MKTVQEQNNKFPQDSTTKQKLKEWHAPQIKEMVKIDLITNSAGGSASDGGGRTTPPS